MEDLKWRESRKFNSVYVNEVIVIIYTHFELPLILFSKKYREKLDIMNMMAKAYKGIDEKLNILAILGDVSFHC